MQLEGKVAVITGAASGMGRAMALLFAREGAKIVGADWHAEPLEAVVAEVLAAGGEMIGVQGNVADRSGAEIIIDTAVSKYGRVDVLCNNAGVMDLNQGVGELTDEMWRRVMGINLDGPMFLTRKVIPLMRAQGGGSIVNTASVAGLGGGSAGAAYTTSKHALIGLTQNTAWRYALEGIRCNAMACGAVETNIMQSVDMAKMDPEGTARARVYQAAIPGMLKADEIAELALFLASDKSRHINGAVIPIDAGWSAA
ncbi:MAG: SDR family oxidoreductase [Coriobacteriia bacterium]|nr:SDR family oxidoreductase [Coriobacteriia bacterium]